ncbi:hypothetical protein [Cellulomonas sp. P5_C5]
MPLVFVHGVSTRSGPGFDRGVAVRDALFRQHLLPALGIPQARISNPLWGDAAARLRWGGRSVPTGKFELLGSGDAALVELLSGALPASFDPAGDDRRALVSIASMPYDPTLEVNPLADAVDVLFGAAVIALDDTEPDAAVELASFGTAAIAYARTNPRPAWVDEVADDDAFVSRLRREVVGPAGSPAFQGMGVGAWWNAVVEGATRIREAVANVVGKKIADRVRPAVTPLLAHFIGDVFVYLHEQGDPAGPVRAIVADAIRAAVKAAPPGEPLVIVAHSMGGDIVYDLLRDQELAELPVHLLVTAGTQIGLFEELKLFRGSDDTIPAGPQDLVPRLPNVTRWINVFDYTDPIGFQAGSIIDGVEDFAFRTGSLVKAHTLYFLQPAFHERLALRAAGAAPSRVAAPTPVRAAGATPP